MQATVFPQRRRATAVLALALALAAGCTARGPAPPPLNSERIAQRFGSFGIEVLRQDDALRITSLYSLERGRRTCRTFALVAFALPASPALAEEDRLIRAGGSLGAVFKARGWRIEKRHRYLGEVAVEPGFACLRELMGPLAAPRLAVHVYDFSVAKHGSRFDYATIAEVHHPDYLDLTELRAIYAGGGSGHAAADPAVAAILDAARRYWRRPISRCQAARSLIRR